MKTLADAGLAVNIGGYIGFNSAWQTVVGNTDRRPTPEEIERMRGMISSGLDQGAWGVSAGLDYKPGYFARTEEVIKVVDVAQAARTNFTNHDRITPESNFSSKVGIAETVAIGEKSGLVPVVTHMKVTGREQGTAGGSARVAGAGDEARTLHGGGCVSISRRAVGPRIADHSGLGGGRRPPGDAEAFRRSGTARAHRQGSGRGDGRAIRRPAERLSAAHAAGADGGDEGDERRRRRDDRAHPRARRRSRRHHPLRRGGGSDQDPAAPGDVDGVRLRRLDRRRACIRGSTDRFRACSGATCASRRSCRGSRRSGSRRGCRRRRSA